MKLHYSLAQIEAFVSVYESGNFAQAAKKLRKDRTTLSELVECLELDLGYALLERQTRPLRLTEQGKMLYRQARLFLQEAEAFGQVAGNLGAKTSHRLTLSYDVFTPREKLLQLVILLRRRNIQLNLICQGRTQAVAGMLQGEVDIGIYQAENKAINEHFRWRVIGALSLAIYARHDYFSGPLVTQLSLATSCQLIPWLKMPERLAQRVQIADRVQVVSDPALLQALLAEGEGWAFLPTHWQTDMHPQIVRVATEIGEEGLTHPLVMLWRPGARAYPALLAVIETLCVLFCEKEVASPPVAVKL